MRWKLLLLNLPNRPLLYDCHATDCPIRLGAMRPRWQHQPERQRLCMESGTVGKLCIVQKGSPRARPTRPPSTSCPTGHACGAGAMGRSSTGLDVL